MSTDTRTQHVTLVAIFNTVFQKTTRTLLYCNKILQQIIKCSAIQHEYVKRGHAASIITTNVQKGVHTHTLLQVFF